MVTAITYGIKITVESFYQPNQSSDKLGQFVFAYRITIENKGAFEIQLLKRHWHIFDSTGEWKEVLGDGVVGEQPTILPDGIFQYISGCHLKTPIGKMFGTYLMQRKSDQKLFDVKIPEFIMIAPELLN